ncbi:tetracycline resistance protein from transposon [Lasiosphaeria hispida]|uniref:Tetracycline resistance protein from transposon n=1 Tax=Lasiosphaeria hispida TaxID=260671 RepID=A0AAJ0H9W8_9PEZI|nr:tetracycline resistance protein from transposon [Lasiosphaeria hispida]
MANSPKIAIIGAGPAGCMLARLLHLANISVTVFEGEASPNYRSQGGTLDLHTTTGLAAVKEAGLFDQFLSKARYDGDSMQFTDKNLKVLFERAASLAPSDFDASGKPRSGLTEQRPEIDRADLRRILTEALPSSIICWNRHLTGFDPETGTLTFLSGAPESGFDLVVGADGAWSKTRAGFRPANAKPDFSGIGLIQLSIPSAATTAPAVHAAVRGGNLFATDNGCRIALQQLGDGSIWISLALAVPSEDWANPDQCGFDVHSLSSVQTALTSPSSTPSPWFRPWHPLLTSALLAAATDPVPRTLYQLPVGFRWPHTQGVTLIGDAAHLMTPFAGEGVNLALMDALVLARRIVQAAREGGEGGLDRAVAGYEEEMWPRAESFARLTDGSAKVWFGETGTAEEVFAKWMALRVKFHSKS